MPYRAPYVAHLTALHRAFGIFNRWWAAPALRLGLGRYLSNPLTGYVMLLRVRGRRTGRWREVPLGYVIVDGAVYCIAGFGRSTQWFRNLVADPRVEVVLPDGAISGLAEEVTDPAESLRAMRPLGESVFLLAWGLTGVDPRRVTDEQLMAVLGRFPLVRIRPRGIAPGPHDPGGDGWIASTAAASLATIWAACAAIKLVRRRPHRTDALAPQTNRAQR